VTGALGAIPWVPVRFSLRAFFIAATLIAVMLGLAVYVLQ
jgi:hypothetical protein